MQLLLRDRLAFVTMTVTHRGATIQVPDVLIDTGSASTLLDADLAAEVGIVAAGGTHVRFMRGVGGREAVFLHTVDRIDVGGRVSRTFSYRSARWATGQTSVRSWDWTS
jgi:predicted aspartyl protease